MSTRRKFIQNLALGGLLYKINPILKHPLHEEVFADKVSWKRVKKSFEVSSSDTLNLNSGSAGNMPKSVLKAYIKNIEALNNLAPYKVFLEKEPSCQVSIDRLGKLIGASGGSIAFTRNSTDSINYVMWGIDWKEGDEIIYAEWDYPFVKNNIARLEHKYGISSKMISGDINVLSDEEIVELYQKAIGPNTRLTVVTWITHREGQILPVQHICDAAKEFETEVLIDGAHTLGQIDVDLSDIKCDYFTSSLHKWLNAPLGSGMLFINNKSISDLNSVMSYPPTLSSDLKKYDYQGTRAFANLMTLSDVLDFNDSIGIQKKSKRLDELKMYWVNAVKDLEHVELISDPTRTCAVSSFKLGKIGGKGLKKKLLDEFNIHAKSTVATGGIGSMLRVSTNIFMDFKDLDRMIDAVYTINKNYL